MIKSINIPPSYRKVYEQLEAKALGNWLQIKQNQEELQQNNELFAKEIPIAKKKALILEYKCIQYVRSAIFYFIY